MKSVFDDYFSELSITSLNDMIYTSSSCQFLDVLDRIGFIFFHIKRLKQTCDLIQPEHPHIL